MGKRGNYGFEARSDSEIRGNYGKTMEAIRTARRHTARARAHLAAGGFLAATDRASTVPPEAA